MIKITRFSDLDHGFVKPVYGILIVPAARSVLVSSRDGKRSGQTLWSLSCDG